MIKIQLDPEALKHLFPPGTEAYASLQSSAIREISKRYIKDSVEPVWRSAVAEAAKLIGEEVKAEVSVQLGLPKFNPAASPLRLSEPRKAEIKDQVRSLVSEEISSIVSKLVALELDPEALRRRIGSAVSTEIRTAVAKEFPDYVPLLKAHINKAMGSLIPGLSLTPPPSSN